MTIMKVFVGEAARAVGHRVGPGSLQASAIVIGGARSRPAACAARRALAARVLDG